MVALPALNNSETSDLFTGHYRAVVKKSGSLRRFKDFDLLLSKLVPLILSKLPPLPSIRDLFL